MFETMTAGVFPSAVNSAFVIAALVFFSLGFFSWMKSFRQTPVLRPARVRRDERHSTARR